MYGARKLSGADRGGHPRLGPAKKRNTRRNAAAGLIRGAGPLRLVMPRLYGNRITSNQEGAPDKGASGLHRAGDSQKAFIFSLARGSGLSGGRGARLHQLDQIWSPGLSRARQGSGERVR